uniref:Uncharacterized protein n=1 Tax=Arundo donax TaxID=35708 RepID=A0A0A9GFG6_ARUDO
MFRSNFISPCKYILICMHSILFFHVFKWRHQRFRFICGTASSQFIISSSHILFLLIYNCNTWSWLDNHEAILELHKFQK